MAFNKKAVLLVFPLALLIMAHCTEAVRMCSSPSETFHGKCVSHKNCASTCYHENQGAGGGHCVGIIWPRCKCMKPCGTMTPPAVAKPSSSAKIGKAEVLHY
ncbi:hypothetical protein EJB05_16495, partial [Eragrostis curvula]